MLWRENSMNFCENFDLFRIERFFVHEKRRKNELWKEKREKKIEIRIKKKRKLARINANENLLMSIFWALERRRSIKKFLLTRALWRRSINDEFFQRQWILSSEFSDEEERNLSDVINYHVIIMNSEWVKKCMINLNSFKKNKKLILEFRSSSFFLRVSKRKKSRKKKVENRKFSWQF
jgi:hypothetical protein